MKFPPVYYGDYLQTDALLATQAPLSRDARGQPAHDEMLFIIVHQAYELWFKQMLHELDLVEGLFARVPLAGADLSRIVHALGRVHEIQRLIIHQLDVLETMTPMGFMEFRDRLFPASGFQSLQFRMIEARLGLSEVLRVPLDGKPVEDRLSTADRTRLAAARARPTVSAQVGAWLSRTPFLDWGGTSFREAYAAAVARLLAADAARIDADPALSADQKARETAALQRANDSFAALTATEGAAHGWTMQPAAVHAALFIMIYRDEPAVALPFRLLQRLLDIDEALALWRYRHALMVERMIGVKVGTGGSSRHAYLRTTAEKHRIFTDLFRLSTFLLPPEALPALPDEVRRRLGFVYAQG
jgi:tryptophan 2,3-dioxygenase